MRRSLTLAAALAFLAIVTRPAQAQITSPPPVSTFHLFTVPGVINAGPMATYIMCSSLSTATQTVTVQAFNQDGTAAGSATVAIDAGKSARFGTQGATAWSVDGPMASPVILVGVARVVSTDKRLACTAMVADSTNSLPVMSQLTIIAKLKQKAAN
jgi:hypothetical protein